MCNPFGGESMADCDLGSDGELNMTLLPGNRIAVSYSEAHHQSSVAIYSLEKDTDLGIHLNLISKCLLILESSL